MKKIFTLTIALALLFVTVSCNMDSTTGLFEDAGTSVKKASYTIHNVIYRFSDTSYLVASDEGVFVFKDGSQSCSSYGTGINAENVVYATGTEDDWYYVYYDESESKYYKMGNTIEKEEYTDIPGTYKNQGMYVYEYIGGSDKGVAIFKNTENGKFCIYDSIQSENEPPADVAFISLDSYSYSGVTYMGDGYFVGEENGTSYYFTINDVFNKTRTENTNSYITHINGIFLTKANSFYSNGSSIGSASSGSTYRRVSTKLSDTNRYILVSGLNYAYYINSSNEVVETSVSGLSSIEVLYIAGVVEGKYINVITAQNGAQSINLEDKSIDSSWK